MEVIFKLEREREVIALCDWLTGNQWFYTSDKWTLAIKKTLLSDVTPDSVYEAKRSSIVWYYQAIFCLWSWTLQVPVTVYFYCVGKSNMDILKNINLSI